MDQKLNKLTEDKIPQEITPFIRSINALMERVQNVLEKQQRFIADAAHELRTPITALSLQAENLKKAKDENDRDAREEKLKLGFVRLGKLVSQLLDLARLQSGKEGEFQTVSFNQVVQEVIASNYPLAEADNIDLGMLRQENGIYVKDQNGRLSQLVQNAIGNAIHYTPKNGKIDVSLFIQGQKAVLLVEDSGNGIPEAELEQVMEPFYRVLEGNQTGNGLGLAISQEIAERLDGKIQLSNREEGGLCFRYEQATVKTDASLVS
ncbi:Sensor protein QseC [Nymphon striatum]|nr:Sensor protein QseC [Nymphon striatum]